MFVVRTEVLGKRRTKVLTTRLFVVGTSVLIFLYLLAAIKETGFFTESAHLNEIFSRKTRFLSSRFMNDYILRKLAFFTLNLTEFQKYTVCSKEFSP
jgi:hypothetical protein